MKKKSLNPQEILNKKFESLELRIKNLEMSIITNQKPQVLKNEFYEEKIEKLKIAAEKTIKKLKQEIMKFRIENKKLKRKIDDLKSELKKERTRK